MAMCSKFTSIKRLLSLICFLIFVSALSQQKKILVYHETNGFRHNSIDSGIDMFKALAAKDNDRWLIDDSDNSNVFTTSNLAQYDAVVFLNTSGQDETDFRGDLLTDSEKSAFEAFIESGKGFIGIHAASDTYRNKIWPFYNELVGAIVQNDPNHTPNNFSANNVIKQSHPIINFLGDVDSKWEKDEEYYYWEINGGQLSTDNQVLLEVESTGLESYDAARPTTWYKEAITYDDDNNVSTPDVALSNIRSFYTSLGHNSRDYVDDNNFIQLIENATLWVLGEQTLRITNDLKLSIKLFPNPTEKLIHIQGQNLSKNTTVSIYNVLGSVVLPSALVDFNVNNGMAKLNVSNLKSGIYFLNVKSDNQSETFKFLKK